jgi:hypothetical protein
MTTGSGGSNQPQSGGSDQPQISFEPDFGGPAGRMFQTLLESLGVAQQPRGWPRKKQAPAGVLTLVELAELSGIGRETWRRCAIEGDLPRLELVPAMGAALRRCKRRITDAQLQQAVLADLAARHTNLPPFRGSPLGPGASPADQIVSVIRGLADEAERDEFIRHVAAILTSDERMGFIRGMANPAVEVAQEETSRDDSDDDGDGSTSG